MHPSTRQCPKCQRTMVVGFVVDKGHHNMPSGPEWCEGQPVRSFWFGLKTKGRESRAVRTFRCTGCGYLESYAADA